MSRLRSLDPLNCLPFAIRHLPFLFPPPIQPSSPKRITIADAFLDSFKTPTPAKSAQPAAATK